MGIVVVMVLFGGAGLVVRLVPAAPEIRIVLFFGLVMLGLAAFAIALFSFVRRRAAGWDDAFAPFGLSGAAYMANGRQYHGLIRGRRVDVYIYRGPIMEAFVGSTVATRLSVGTREVVGAAIRSLAGMSELALHDPDYAGVVARADDPRWAGQLLSHPAAKQRVLGLVHDPNGREMRMLMIAPESVGVRRTYLSMSDMSADVIGRLLDDLAGLADLAEQSPAPARQLAPTPLDRSMRTDRDAVNSKIRLVVFGVFGLLAVLVTCIAFALVFLGESTALPPVPPAPVPAVGPEAPAVAPEAPVERQRRGGRRRNR